MDRRLCIGLDFGSDSVRAVLVDSSDGSILVTHVSGYKRWKEGKYCEPSKYQFRQHPADHMESLEEVVQHVINSSDSAVSEIKSLCIDTTGSSPVPVDEQGFPLALKEEFSEDPDAMVILWKDHTAIREAEEINQLAKNWGGTDFTKYSGGIYSSEWFWSKILHVSRSNDQLKRRAYTWMEHCDLLAFMLSDIGDLKEMKRSRCAAGHKAMWHESWGGYPSIDFLEKLDPYLGQVVATLPKKTYTSDIPVGRLNQEWAEKLGLSTDVIVTVGILDAHAGAVGGEIEEGTLVRVMGTSTCDMLISQKEVVGDLCLKGISGQVDGSIVPGMIGFEAGQSAFGDVLDWFKRLLSWPLDQLHTDALSAEELEEMKGRLLDELTIQAERLPIDQTDITALDWLNGRRTPDANPLLKGAITGITIGTNAPMIYKALVESICFGAKKIVNRFIEEGLEIKSIVGIGGVANKSSFIMQILADILNMPIKVVASQQTGGLGAAMFAAVAAKIYPSIKEAINHMGHGFKQTYYPNQENVLLYKKLFERYCELGEFVESKTEALQS
ncbi:MAG: ribulokinase [Bacteroidota bacterium]